jgi:hypothetical protein
VLRTRSADEPQGSIRTVSPPKRATSAPPSSLNSSATASSRFPAKLSSPLNLSARRMTPMLSEAQVQHFRTEGWVALERFWDQHEIAAMRADLGRLKAEGLIANVATAGDGVTPPATLATSSSSPSPRTAACSSTCRSRPRRPRPWAT